MRTDPRVVLIVCTLAAAGIVTAERGVVLIQDPAGNQVGLYAESHALLVGVSDYRAGWPDLESVPRELDRVERMLKARGFAVVRVSDPNGKQLKRAFEDFIDDYGYRRGNRLLFFFAGHGHTWEEEGHGYLVPSDAPRPLDPTGDPGPEFLRKALFMSDILAWSRKMTANHALFLFDSCFSGAVFKERALPPRPSHISAAMARPVREFITAGSAGESVPARSVFTPAFVDAIEYAEGDLNGDGYVTGMELGLHLEATVPRHARQSPQFGKHPEYRLSRGDFVFVLEGTENCDDDGETAEQALALTPAQRRQVQAALNALGWDAGPVDGLFGQRTRRALTAYQRSLGVRETCYLTAEQLARLSQTQTGRTWKEPVTGMEFAWVPEGFFEMGSEDGDADERPVHRVRVQGFWLGKHEVTQRQWRRVMGENPARFNKGDNYPVEEVSWESVQAFIAKLNAMGQGGFRLPSEAEWEYACRGNGGSETYCGGEDVDALAWYSGNSGRTTHAVGRKRVNALGLHDMSGNLWEWVQDCHRDSYREAPEDGSAMEEDTCARRVIRGGSWDFDPQALRSASRHGDEPWFRASSIGFRLARTP